MPIATTPAIGRRAAAGSDATRTAKAAPRDHPVRTTGTRSSRPRAFLAAPGDSRVLGRELTHVNQRPARPLDVKKRFRAEPDRVIAIGGDLLEHVHGRTEPAAIAARVDHQDVAIRGRGRRRQMQLEGLAVQLHGGGRRNRRTGSGRGPRREAATRRDHRNQRHAQMQRDPGDSSRRASAGKHHQSSRSVREGA